MAANKQEKSVPTTDERVEVFIPRGAANDDPNFYVSVNGYRALLPKGKKSLVPKYVAYEIERSFSAQEALDSRVEKMLDESK